MVFSLQGLRHYKNTVFPCSEPLKRCTGVVFRPQVALWDCLGAAKTLHRRGVSHTGALTSVVFRPQGPQKHRVFAFAPRALTKCFKVALLGLLLVHFWPKASKTLENRPPGDTFGTCLAQGFKMFKIGLLGSLLAHFWPKASKCSK